MQHYFVVLGISPFTIWQAKIMTYDCRINITIQTRTQLFLWAVTNTSFNTMYSGIGESQNGNYAHICMVAAAKL